MFITIPFQGKGLGWVIPQALIKIQIIPNPKITYFFQSSHLPSLTRVRAGDGLFY